MTERIEIRPLRTAEEYRACVGLQQETWGADFTELVPAELLRIAQRMSGVAAGAFDAAGRLYGFVFGITGFEAGRPVHWSDMLAVRREQRNRGVGERLKRHQREVLLPLGVQTVYWSFEPLESKNAYLNLARLGAVVRDYQPNAYGETDSPLHRGIGTDRLVAVWRIAEDRVQQRLDGGRARPSAEQAAAIPLINPTRLGRHGLGSDEPALELDAPAVRLAIPVDIQKLKSEAPDLAANWRQRTRAAFLAYLGRGYEAVDLVREAERSCYLLAREPFSW